MAGAAASTMSRFTLASLFGLLAIHGASAALTSNLKLAQQLPQVGHMSEPYTWTISQDTFQQSDSSKLLADAKLDVQGLPQWAKFDAASRTFSGTPAPSDIGRTSIKVVATDGDGAGAKDSFDLIVVAQPAPVVAKPLPLQLPEASSLGPQNILPGNRLHIPPGWSFSLGFDGATFSIPDGSSVYMTPALGNFQPLPSWLHWGEDTYALYGVAPPNPGPEGNSFDFVLTGSNVEGFGGVSTSVTLVVSPHALTSGVALKPLNVTAGSSLTYTVPTTGLRLDGKPNPPSNQVQIAADLSTVQWLSFDASSNVLSGTPPADTFNSTTITSVPVPLTYRDTFNNTLPVNVTVNVYPSPFTLQALPNVEVELGQAFTVPLASYVRKLNDSDHRAVSATFDPPVSWLTFDNASYVLSGTAQKTAADTRVTVNLKADAASGDQVQTSFQLGAKGDKSLATPTTASAAPTGGSASDAGSSSGSSGLSHKAKLALGIALGSIGGLILLILLMMCCRRHVAVEEHDTSGNLTSSIVDDDKTMTASPASDWKKGGGKWGTPSTLAASPNYLHPEWAAGAKKVGGSPVWSQQQVEFVEVNMNDPFAARGRGSGGGYTQHLQVPRKQVPALIEQPRRVSAFSIFKRGPSAKDLAAQAKAEAAAYTRSPPSGLGLEGVIVESPAEEPTVHHSRTRHSVISHRSSWEDGIFESRRDIAGASDSRRGSGAPSEISFHSADDAGAEAEVPRRRGGAGPMRQRNQYANHSPAFMTNGTFDADAPVASSVEGSDDPFEDSRTGLESEEGGATYHTGVRVDVRKQGAEYVPSPGHRANKSRGGRSSMDQSAFMDAPESDESFPIGDHEEEVPRRSRAYDSVAPKRNSTASATSVMTHNSHLRALEPYIATGEAENQGSSRDSAQQALSPRPPSFFGGTSYNGDVTSPEETLRAVPSRRTTAEPSTPKREYSRGPSQIGHWGEQDELIELEVGRLPSLIIAPKWGPQLSGPGSPGKRGGRRPKYRLIVNDERFPEDSGTWPVWLRDWTQWNEERCELLFTVPISEELAYEIGEVRITLQECKNWAAQPPSPAIGGYNAPGSPGKRGSVGISGHRHIESIDSARTFTEERWEDCLSKVLAFVLPAGAEEQAYAYDDRRPSNTSSQSPYAF